VSVTQHFNTADSIGRLTLNILLSFAQFEREIIAERTRDKIAAARRRGQWAGGRPILGYDLVKGEHRLTVNRAEAKQVRAIFGIYLEKESILATAQTLNARGWTTKRWTAANGNIIGGKPFDTANLRHLLRNVAYLGKVRHRDQTHPGQHQAIIDSATFEKVQRLLRRNARTAGSFLRNKHGALLKGLLRCKACDAAMVQMVSRKGPKLHRYYVCTRAQKRGYDQCPTGTILAGALERQVCDHLQQLAKSAQGPSGCNGRPLVVPDAQAGRMQEGTLPESGDVARFLAGDWNNLPPLEQARVIRFIIESVQYDAREEQATVRLTPEAATGLTQNPGAKPGMGEDHARDREAIRQVEFTVSGLKPTQRRRRSRSHQASGSVAPAVRTLVLAYQIEQTVREGRARDYAEVAKQLGMTRARVSQILRLLRLPPAVLETLLLTDQTCGPRLSERHLRPMVATSGPFSGP
jgi:hypothetical protein